MGNEIYAFNSYTLELIEYDTVEDFIDDVINETFLEELYNEVYGEVLLPILGSIGVGTLLKEHGVIMEAADGESDCYISEIEYELENNQVSYFWNWTLSYDKELFEETIKGE